jgi:hypothetical protein
MKPIVMADTYRTLLSIVGRWDDLVIVMIPGWRTDMPAAFRFDAVPADLQPHIKADGYLLAQVNIDAEHADDLQFADFTEAPQPANI